MNSSSEQRFFDLAMKSATGQCTEAEKAELDSLVKANPELKTELDRLLNESRIAREVVPLMAATGSVSGEFPGYARERLQTKVRQKLVERKEVVVSWSWRWLLGLGAGVAVVLVALVVRQNAPPVMEIALLDPGLVRGAANQGVGALTNRWRDPKIQVFSSDDALKAWETNRTAGSTRVVRVIYDPAAAEIRVVKLEGAQRQERVFQVETNLENTLRLIDEYVRGR